MNHTANPTTFTKDLAHKKITIERRFSAPRNQVWKAWTTPEILDLWWAPKPWTAKTKFMDFREGGYWLYCMCGPNGEQSWAQADYIAIDPEKSFTGDDVFCDENGNANREFPKVRWQVQFYDEGNNTRVTVVNQFESEHELETLIEMGFKEGFESALVNLDEWLAQ